MGKQARMVTQVSGTRNGVAWPEPGMPAPDDLSDSEVRALVNGGSAVWADSQSDPVLVPPAGVHTPGRVAYGDVDLIEAPADAVADPEAATEAARKAKLVQMTGDGADHTVPAGTGVQHHGGAAMTREQIDEGLEVDIATAEDYGLPLPGERAPMSTSYSSAQSKGRAARLGASETSTKAASPQSTSTVSKAAEKSAAESNVQGTSTTSKAAEKSATDSSKSSSKS